MLPGIAYRHMYEHLTLREISDSYILFCPVYSSGFFKYTDIHQFVRAILFSIQRRLTCIYVQLFSLLITRSYLCCFVHALSLNIPTRISITSPQIFHLKSWSFRPTSINSTTTTTAHHNYHLYYYLFIVCEPVRILNNSTLLLYILPSLSCP